MCFRRTDAGLESEYLFHQEVLVYVEGYSDIPFYENILYNYNCRIKAQNGKNECEKFVGFLEKDDYPYVVVLDGDYEILEDTQSQHSRVIVLERYSVESYLFEKDPIIRFARYSFKKTDSKETPISNDEFTQFLEQIEEELMELLILDVARHRSRPEIGKYLDRSGKFFNKGFKKDQIEKKLEIAKKNIKKESINEARILVKEYLKQNRFIDLLPGHFAFGLMCEFVKQKVGKAFHFDSIWLFLTAIVPDNVETPHHIRLHERLCSAVREAQKIR